MKKFLKKLGKISLYIIGVLVILFIAAYFLTMGEYHIPKTVEQDSGLPRIELNGYTFHSEVFGDPSNPVTIVLHGGPGADYDYLLTLKPLASDYFLVFYDQRGTGLSPRVPNEQLTVDTYIADLDAFVEHFGKGKRVHLIGHSWGAMLASAYVGKHPEKVDKLVLAEPGFLTAKMAEPLLSPTITVSMIYNMAKAWFQSLHIGSDEPDPDAAQDYFFSRMLSLVNPEYNCAGHPPEGTEVVRPGMAVFKHMAMRLMQDEELRKTIDFRVGVEHFTSKVLFIASECNRLIGEAHQRQQMKFFPNAELIVIKDSGHFMFNEKPEQCMALIKKYFKEDESESPDS